MTLLFGSLMSRFQQAHWLKLVLHYGLPLLAIIGVCVYAYVRHGVPTTVRWHQGLNVATGSDMANKKKKRRQKSRQPQTRPFENLLRIGETTLYGQVCWSIANRGTEPPRSGEVITLEGGEGSGGQTSRAFRLTRKSVENIEPCLVLRTCGEAVELFAYRVEPDPSGAPLDDCPHGHQEAAFAYMMYGIEPTEPCPECGEIPTFGSMSMSPDFYPDDPVKGVDGQEYATCPPCGEDALEIRGEGIAKWGWTIGCLNCEWEMKLAESLDIAQYCDLMDEVKSRVESINPLMEMPGITIRTRVESICLQLRMLLEFIVFSPWFPTRMSGRGRRRSSKAPRTLARSSGS